MDKIVTRTYYIIMWLKGGYFISNLKIKNIEKNYYTIHLKANHTCSQYT